MRTLLSDLWAFTAGRTDNPVYRHELARWSRLSAWRRSGWLVAIIAFGIPIILAGTPMTLLLRLPYHPSLVGVIVLLMGQEIAKQAACLGAAALTGATTAGRVEDHTDDLLRLSPLPRQQIVLAKVGAALRPLCLWPITVTAARLLLLLLVTQGWVEIIFYRTAPAGISQSGYQFLATMPPVIRQAMSMLAYWGYHVWATFYWQISDMYITSLRLLWPAYYLIQPLFDFILSASLGMFAASRARIRAGGLTAALGLAAVMWILGYVGERALSVLVTLLWPMDRSYGGVVTPLQWMIGMPAMDGSFVVIGGPFEVMLGLMIIAKVSLLLWLFYATNQWLRAIHRG